MLERSKHYSVAKHGNVWLYGDFSKFRSIVEVSTTSEIRPSVSEEAGTIHALFSDQWFTKAGASFDHLEILEDRANAQQRCSPRRE